MFIFMERLSSGGSLAYRYLILALLGFPFCVMPNAFAQQETETSPIIQNVTVTASVNPSCAFWMDKTWMTLGAYEGNVIAANNRTNMRCSVLPSGLNNQINNFAPICMDAGLHYVPQADPNNIRSPRTMLLEGGDPNNLDHRLDYNIGPLSGYNASGTEVEAIGTGHDGSEPGWIADSTQCADASPNGNLHPGRQWGYNVGPGGANNEVPNQTYSTDIVFYIYGSADQPGTPVAGNYSDTVTVYFVFKEP